MRSYLMAAAVAIVVLVGCTPSAPDPTSTPSPSLAPVASATPTLTPSPTPTPTPSPSPTAAPSFPTDLPTEDPEVAAIIQGWKEYWRVYEKFAADPLVVTNWTETQYVTTGDEASEILTSIDVLREDRIRLEGGQVFREVAVEQISQDKARMTYCVDLNNLVVYEIDTGERVPREGTLRETTTMERGADKIWRVSGIRNESATC